MRLAPVFLVHHVRKNLRQVLPAHLLSAAKLRNQCLPVKLGIKNMLLLRIRIEKRHVGLHHRQSLASLLKHHPERRKLKINVFPMHLRILLPAIKLAEIHQESLKDAVHPELILREIHKLQSSILILTRKRRIPNQLANIQRQQINPMMTMPRKMPMMTPSMIPQKPLQQPPSNSNLLNMRKSCQSLSQPHSDILINPLNPHQPLQGRKDNPVDDHILR